MKRYEVESGEAFRTSSQYRQFLFNYIRFCNVPFKGYEISDQAWPLLLPDYYKALGSFHSREMRDWFMTKYIMDAFEYYPFEEADTVYRDFMTKDPAPFYADTLKRFYADYLKLKPGSPAPAFVLKNEAGQDVSLSDFRGRTVYIDFWGVGCSPCVWDIKNHVPALHSRYKDKAIVFINICVDSDEKAWKKSLGVLNPDGVNLLAEGWTHNPVCKVYHINGIPHYCLIDKDGRIINAVAPRPSDGGLFRLLDKIL
jgi:peroxiredoxin